jgi:hypothetical protein
MATASTSPSPSGRPGSGRAHVIRAVELVGAKFMAVFFVSLILCSPYLVMALIRARLARTRRPGRSEQGHTEPPTTVQVDAHDHAGPAWTALDDRQLTRLLIDSAPRATPE